ncbi:MAG TPA: O-antigen ligase family protein [Candidatus Dormibacteraeota bacterium]|nr:O-antigen ligase family protein [Candidatus Dormibacteraeota bacterium]
MALARKLEVLKPLTRAYIIFLVYGVFEVIRGIFTGHPPLATFRDLAFNYYPLYLLLGLWAGLTSPAKLARNIRIFAWINGIYGSLFILVLNRIEWYLPGVDDAVAPVPVFTLPLFSFVAILGLLGFESDWSKSWYLHLLNAFVLLGAQIRTEWLALSIGLLCWFILSPQRKLLLKPVVAVVTVVFIMFVTNFSIPSVPGRAQEDLNVRQLVYRATVPFHTDVSDINVATGAAGADSQEATLVWRTVWWIAIWDSVHSSKASALFGLGYGYALGDEVPYLEGQFIRTPHNQFFYALGYTGWIGVVLFYWFQFELARLLLRVKVMTGEPVAIVLWVAFMVFAFAVPFYETPHGAIPFYLLIGWLAAPAVRQG